MDAATRQFVQERSGNRCEYCHLPQAAATFLAFHVEHIQARQHIVDDSSENLAWACPDCNRHKGPNLSSVDPLTRQVVLLFNPRNNNWSDHFRREHALIIGLTASGRATVRLLRMNSEARVEIRSELLTTGEW